MSYFLKLIPNAGRKQQLLTHYNLGYKMATMKFRLHKPKEGFTIYLASHLDPSCLTLGQHFHKMLAI